MSPHASSNRIAINVAHDALLAAAALFLAAWIAVPSGAALPGPGLLAWGVVALLAAGAPFRLALQYWRFTGMADLLGVAASSITAATLFALGLQALGLKLPSPAFPVLHLLCLLVLLGLPRMAYRMLRERPAPAPDVGSGRPVLLVGAGERADLFLRALAADPAAPWRAVGVLSLGQAQTGRRIQGCPVLGSVDQAPSVLAGLSGEDAHPTLVLTEPDLPSGAMAALHEAADAAGAAVARAPNPTALA